MWPWGAVRSRRSYWALTVQLTFHRRMFDEYYAFAEALLKSGLIGPALEHVLKCSHLFNILDSSNSIGVTERTAYILRVRRRAVGIAQAYVEETTPKVAV